MRRLLQVVLVVSSLGIVAVAGAPPAGAITLNGGCTATVESRDGGGRVIDTATADGKGGTRGTRGDPLRVASDGRVVWKGQGPVIKDQAWHVSVYGVRVKSGRSSNASGATTAGRPDGEKVDAYLPVKAAGLYYVSGALTGDPRGCSGYMWVKVKGNGILSLPGIVALVVLVGGLVLVASARPKVVRT